MIKIKDLIRYSYPIVFLRILYARLVEVPYFAKNMYTFQLRKNPKKLKADLTIRAHALEKGMSIGGGRYGFGIPKAIELIQDLDLFLMIKGEQKVAVDCLSVVKKYVDYNKSGGADMERVEYAFNQFQTKWALPLIEDVGLLRLSQSNVTSMAHGSFDVFSQSRYSIRDFGVTPVDVSLLRKSFELCEKTPTACNRQSQRVHVYLKKEHKDKICGLQGGCQGFYQNMQGAILVCGDLNMYGFQELNQVFVDGGLYAMNLMYALHFYDIASIPLTMAHKADHVQKIRKEMGIPENELPVLLIGIGSYKEEFKAAYSLRNSYEDYVSFE